MYSVVFITGASSGIGKSLAYTYAKQGYRLALLARRKDRLLSIQADIESKYPVQVLPLIADVRDEAKVKLAFQQTIDTFGKIDIVIANAGNGVSGKVEDLCTGDFSRQFDVNIIGVLNTVKAAIDPLKKTKGRLAIMGSICSYISLPTSAPYSMSKYAVRALSESLRYELAPFKISVTLICPGFIESEFRQVDNLGIHHNEAHDPIPRWLLGDVKKAASSMFRAIKNRKKVLFFTKHAYVLYALRTYSSPIFDFLAVFLPKLFKKKHKVTN